MTDMFKRKKGRQSLAHSSVPALSALIHGKYCVCSAGGLPAVGDKADLGPDFAGKMPRLNDVEAAKLIVAPAMFYLLTR